MILRSIVDGRRTPRWSLILTFLLASVLLFLAFRGVNWNEMAEVVRHGRLGYLALAFLILSVSYSIRGLRWGVLLSAEKFIAPVTLFWVTAVGYLGNSFLPARAGELIRSMLLGRSANMSKSYVLATALTERILDVLALVSISLMALMSLEGIPDWLLTTTRVGAVLGLGAVVALVVATRLDGLIKNLLTRLSLRHALGARLSDSIGQFLLGMRAFQHSGRALLFASLTVVIWLTDALMAIVVGRALNLTLALRQALLLLAALGLSSAVPSTPGYVGIYQFVAVTVLAPFGFSRNEALVYIIAFQAVSYSVVIVWGAAGLWRSGTTMPGAPLLGKQG